MALRSHISCKTFTSAIYNFHSHNFLSIFAAYFLHFQSFFFTSNICFHFQPFFSLPIFYFPTHFFSSDFQFYFQHFFFYLLFLIFCYISFHLRSATYYFCYFTCSKTDFGYLWMCRKHEKNRRSSFSVFWCCMAFIKAMVAILVFPH